MNCIFGIFDVLGFTGFCENCDFHNAERVLKIMDDFETEIPAILLDGLDINNNAPTEKKELIQSRLKWLTFSDTIFVAMPIDVSDHPNTVMFNLIFFTSLVAYINRRMFEIGLPVRGAIHRGDVMVSKRCFAGKAVVEAHKLGEKCQLAATVVSEEAHAFILNILSEPNGYHSFYSSLVVECDVPTGTAQISKSLWGTSTERLKTICWFYLQLGRMEEFVMPLDLSGFIRDRFSAHGKQLSGEKEVMKAVNTEKLFRDWQAASHSQYQEHVGMTSQTNQKSA